MFRIRWARRALDELTILWTNADSAQRQAITQASHDVEVRLLRDPHNEGESRPFGRKVTFEPPLTVIFQIEPDGQTVSVLHIRVFRMRRP